MKAGKGKFSCIQGVVCNSVTLLMAIYIRIIVSMIKHHDSTYEANSSQKIYQFSHQGRPLSRVSGVVADLSLGTAVLPPPARRMEADTV